MDGLSWFLAQRVLWTYSLPTAFATCENPGRCPSQISRSTPTSQPKLLQASRKMGGSAAEGSITPDDNNKNMYNTAKYPMIVCRVANSAMSYM